MYIITNNLEENFKKAKAGINNPVPQMIKLPKIKHAQAKMPRMQRTAGADIEAMGPQFYSPLWLQSTLQIPADRRTLHQWIRYYDDTDPIVGNTIKLHTEFPLSKLNLGSTGDKAIDEFFEDMCNRIDLLNLVLDIGREYWLIGNVFPFGSYNEDEGMWEKFVVLNPDYVQIEGGLLIQDPIYKLLPDDELKALVSTREPYELYEQLSPDIIRFVELGMPIPLDRKHISHIAHNRSPYETWGKPLILRILKILMYEDRLTEANFAIAERHITPLLVAKVGDPQSGWQPDQQDIDEVRDMLAAASIDPAFTFIYHYGINFEYVGATGKILPLHYEFNRIEEMKLAGLGINKAMIHGEGPTYANASVGLDVLIARYLTFRDKIERWIYAAVFEPIAEKQGFYSKKVVNGRKQLLYPKIQWAKMQLGDDITHKQMMFELMSRGYLPKKTFFPFFGLNWDDIKQGLVDEMNDKTDPITNPPNQPRVESGPDGNPVLLMPDGSAIPMQMVMQGIQIIQQIQQARGQGQMKRSDAIRQFVKFAEEALAEEKMPKDKIEALDNKVLKKLAFELKEALDEDEVEVNRELLMVDPKPEP